MFSKGQRKGTIRFQIKTPNNAKKVSLAGDFNNWTPTPMRRQKDGSFAVTVKLGAGTHEYKFIVDNDWVVDPDNGAWALNPFGTVNSVAMIE